MSISGLTNQKITVYSSTGYDAYGETEYGAGTTYKARFQTVNKTVLLPNGDVSIINAIVYIDGAPSINTQDKISYSNIDYRIHGKSTGIDGQGNTHHTKLELVKWNV